MSKHTPRPWLHRAKSDSVHKPPPEQPYQFGDQIFRFHDEQGPSDADLALILAAPDLLEALRIAEAALSDIGDADREPGDDVAWCEARAAGAIPQVRAAIKAVEGEKT